MMDLDKYWIGKILQGFAIIGVRVNLIIGDLRDERTEGRESAESIPRVSKQEGIEGIHSEAEVGRKGVIKGL